MKAGKKTYRVKEKNCIEIMLRYLENNITRKIIYFWKYKLLHCMAWESI